MSERDEWLTEIMALIEAGQAEHEDVAFALHALLSCGCRDCCEWREANPAQVAYFESMNATCH